MMDKIDWIITLSYASLVSTIWILLRPNPYIWMLTVFIFGIIVGFVNSYIRDDPQ
jgi:hypothetical protein